MSTPPTPLAGPRVAVTLTRATIGIVGAIALLSGIAILTFGAIDFVGGALSGQWQFTLVGNQPIPSGTDHGPATIVHGSWETATVVLAGVSGAAAVFSVIASVTSILTPVAFCTLVVVLCWRLLSRRLFRRSLWISLGISGGVIAIGGLLGQGASSLASGTAAALLNGGTGRGFWPLAGRADLTWPVIGLALMLIGLAFEYGERLQRDVEGLV